MNVLALETTTSICSVALKLNGAENPEELKSSERSHHSENLFRFTCKLLEQNDLSIKELDAVVVSSGPGSYTGLRIAASGVKGLLFDTGVPLYAVNTLAGFAVGGLKQSQNNKGEDKSTINHLHSVLDARRKHLYHQFFIYSVNELTGKTTPEITPIKEIETMLEAGDMIVGTGIKRLDGSILEQVIVEDETTISAMSLLKIHEKAIIQDRPNWKPFIKKVSPVDFEPDYLAETQTRSKR